MLYKNMGWRIWSKMVCENVAETTEIGQSLRVTQIGLP